MQNDQIFLNNQQSQNTLINNKNLDYFQSHIFKIPKDIHIEIVPFSSIQNSNTLPKGTQRIFKCIGPLGSILVDFQKFDKFGFCFFEIQQSTDSQQQKKEKNTFLKVSIKTFNHPSKSASFFQFFQSFYKQIIEGLTQGYVLYLELHGVGFRAFFHKEHPSIHNKKNKDIKDGVQSQHQFLELKLGQSHDIFYEIPHCVHMFLVKPTMIGIYGIDKQKVTQIGAELRHFKLPDAYKGKGIRYKDEKVNTKTGKK